MPILSSPPNLLMQLSAIGIGAVLGAWLRWGISLWLNTLHLWLPLGTLIVNWAGAVTIGVLIIFFQEHHQLSPLWRLMIITGFLGALTTFSTFSAESLALIMQGHLQESILHILLHTVGSLLCCALGIKIMQWVKFG
jgi:fluoride exporter